MDYITIGHTQKAHGVEGELKLHIEAQYLEDFLKNERIFVDVKGKMIPYFIESVRGTNNLILKLEEVDDRDAAFMLQSRAVLLRKQDLIPEHARELEIEEEEELAFGHLTGWTLHDQTLGVIGVIDEILEMPQQEMAFLKWKGRDVLIPLNQGLIVEQNEAQKTVVMDLPEGLLDV